MHALEKRLDVVEAGFQIKRTLHPGVADIGHTAQVVGTDAAGLIDLAHQARLIADLPRPVACAGAIGDAAIEGHTDHGDVHLRQILTEWRAHEGRYAGVTRPHHLLAMVTAIVHGSPAHE